ncbi:MAG: globin domain-containing protein [Methyloceanibacter sp.]|uniref:globin domain-containing protein n=1 Tax=Methyloceanibacter sp. TaxID=1965321 RepID=UPI003EDF0808
MPAALQSTLDAPKKRTRRRAAAAPSGETHLSAEQKRLIRLSFLRIEPALDLVAQLFFLKLFRLDPSLRKKFTGPVEIQAKKFAAGAKLAMISLGHEDGLAPTLKLLGARHRQMGIRTRHYRTMSRALVWTLERSLDKAFDRDTKDAWNALLAYFTKVMAG